MMLSTATNRTNVTSS